MRPYIEKQASDGSEHSNRSSENSKRKWPGRITSKLSIALDATHTNPKTNAGEVLTARSDCSSSSSDKSLSCSSLDSAEEEEVGDWFAGNDDEEVEDWLADVVVCVRHVSFPQFSYV
jgi:hypothetical protein